MSLPIDFQKINDNLSNDLLSICKQKNFISKLKIANDFFNSEMWKKLHSQEDGHSIAYDYISEILGKDKVAIYNDKGVNYDSSDIISKLSPGEREFLNKVDSEKLPGVFKFERFYFQYIGSTVISTDDYKIKADVNYKLEKILDSPLTIQMVYVIKDIEPEIDKYGNIKMGDYEGKILTLTFSEDQNSMYVNVLYEENLYFSEMTTSTEIYTITPTDENNTQTFTNSDPKSYTSSLGVYFLFEPKAGTTQYKLTVTIPAEFTVTKGQEEICGPFVISESSV